MLNKLLKFSAILLVGGCVSLYAEYPTLTQFYQQHYTEDFNAYNPNVIFKVQEPSREEQAREAAKLTLYQLKFPLKRYLKGDEDKETIKELQGVIHLEWQNMSPSFKLPEYITSKKTSPQQSAVIETKRKILADQEKYFDKIYQEVKQGKLYQYQQMPKIIVGNMLVLKYAKIPYAERFKKPFYPEIMALFPPNERQLIQTTIEYGNVVDAISYYTDIIILPMWWSLEDSENFDNPNHKILKTQQNNIKRQLKQNFTHTPGDLASLQTICEELMFEDSVAGLINELGDKFPKKIPAIKQNIIKACECRVDKYAKFFSSKTIQDALAVHSINLTIARYVHFNFFKGYLSSNKQDASSDINIINVSTNYAN